MPHPKFSTTSSASSSSAIGVSVVVRAGPRRRRRHAPVSRTFDSNVRLSSGRSRTVTPEIEFRLFLFFFFVLKKNKQRVSGALALRLARRLVLRARRVRLTSAAHTSDAAHLSFVVDKALHERQQTRAKLGHLRLADAQRAAPRGAGQSATPPTTRQTGKQRNKPPHAARACACARVTRRVSKRGVLLSQRCVADFQSARARTRDACRRRARIRHAAAAAARAHATYRQRAKHLKLWSTDCANSARARASCG